MKNAPNGNLIHTPGNKSHLMSWMQCGQTSCTVSNTTSASIIAAYQNLIITSSPANNIKVTAEELDLLHENKTDRVQVTGGDYASVLGIFHHLHCLNVLRQVVHWDYYESKNLSSSPEVYDVAHQGKLKFLSGMFLGSQSPARPLYRCNAADIDVSRQRHTLYCTMVQRSQEALE